MSWQCQNMFRALAIALIVLGSTTHADAEGTPWYRGKYGRNRVTHLTITLGAGAGWLSTQLFQIFKWQRDLQWYSY